MQITAVGNLGTQAGYNTRSWVRHGKLPWVDYSAQPAAQPVSSEKTYTAAEVEGIVAAALGEALDGVKKRLG